MTTELEQRLKQRYGLEEVHDVESIQPAVETLAAVDDPQDEYFVIHVAGTNGKGSTCTLIAQMLQQAGHSVGLYTGPALNDFRSQFRVDGEPITEERLFELADRIDAAAEPSMYELSTAVAFLQFAREDVDVAVIETGVGGRLDATNVADSGVCVITSVGMDHSDVLGDTREQIAGEKAAIIDPSTMAVVSAVDDAVHEVIAAAAAASNAPVHRPASAVRLQDRGGITLEAVMGGRRTGTDIVAGYQQRNINTAVAAVRAAPFEVDADDIMAAVAGFRMPARMEPVAEEPLTLLDGAHNPMAIETIEPTVERMEPDPVIVFSVMDDKDWGAMLDVLVDHADRFVFSRASEDRAADPEELARATDAESTVVPDPVAAVQQAREAADPGQTVLVTGSLYFCGDVRPHLCGD